MSIFLDDVVKDVCLVAKRVQSHELVFDDFHDVGSFFSCEEPKPTKTIDVVCRPVKQAEERRTKRRFDLS